MNRNAANAKMRNTENKGAELTVKLIIGDSRNELKIGATMWLLRRIGYFFGIGRLPEFKPCVIYNEPLRLTEMILEDTSIVWVPWGPYKGHAVDCGYSFDGRLVGIKIWDDVRHRK